MKSQLGLSLVELLITVAITVILLAVAAPAFRDLVYNNRATAVANEFFTVISFARSEAVKSVRDVRLSAVNPGADGNEWGAGWRVWVDVNGNGACDAGEELRVKEALGGGATLESAENASEIRFLANGFTNIPAGQTRGFTLRLPGCEGDQGRGITVTPVGKVNVVRETCS